jgi:phage baseplate assembly protein W
VIFYFGVFIKNSDDTIFIVMADGTTYGLTFPFRDSFDGKYLDLSDYNDQEIRSNLIHLLLSKKGSRYYLPDFGTKIYEFIFEPLDGVTFESIKDDIRDNVSKYIPNLIINDIIVLPYDEYESVGTLNTENLGNGVYRVAGRNTSEYTAKMRIDYTISDNAFQTKDFVIINI